MNETMRNQTYCQETEIDIINLCIYIARRWKILLICMLIGAVIGAGASIAGGLKAGADTTSNVASEDTYPQVGFLTPESELDFGTEEEMAAVLGIVTDPAKLTEEVVNMTRVNQYINYLNMYDEEIASEQRMGFADSEGNLVVRDSETAARLLTLRQSYRYKIADFERDFLTNYDLAYYEYTYGDKDKAAQILKDSAALKIREKKQLTLDYKANSSGGILGKLAEKNNEATTNQVSTNDNPLRGFSLKKTILGAFVALFLAACWFALRYVLDRSIKDVDEIKRRYGLAIIGSVNNQPLKTGLDGLLDKLEHRNNVVHDREYVADAIRPVDCESMLLVGDSSDADTADMMNWVSSNDGRCAVSGFLATDKDALAKASDCSGIILFVRMWKTTSIELIHELETASHLGKRIIGVVTVE